MGEGSLIHTLRELCALPAPSGSEQVVTREMARRWGTASECDAVGNVLVRVGGEGSRTLIHAHADQVGYVIVAITPDGFGMLDTAQNLRGNAPEVRWPVGQGARVGTRDGGWVPGIFAAASGHVTRHIAPENHRLTWDNFWVDFGLATRAEVEAGGVHIGAPVVFEAAIRQLGEHRVSGCAMDDRVGLTVMDAVHAVICGRRDLACDVWLAVTTREEGGMHGAAALAHAERFERVIGLEVGLCGDLPGISQLVHPGRLGSGPMIVHKDGTTIYDRELCRALLKAGQRAGVAVQDVAFSHYGSDGVRFTQGGSPSALLAIPTRYTHTGFEMVDLRDLAATVDLLTCFVT